MLSSSCSNGTRISSGQLRSHKIASCGGCFTDGISEQVNDGRTISVEFKQGDGSVLQIGDKEVFPTKLSFHSPSMHKLNGTYYDMEMQVMHKDSADNMVIPIQT